MRHCPVCQSPFTPAFRNPHQRYCSSTCRATAGRRRKSARTADRRDGVTTADGVRPGGVAGVAVQCPHCNRPVTVVALLVPPGAATVRLGAGDGRD